ncbi:metallophosphoesterase [Paludisphaera mucosa]|uniref:Phosphoesterase n=1 Tax=Paludisphaera mucosa TaxID=3030827 RepID=A0ABT6FDH0_9BACT|nr:metallophosphoesterase [Paludisphaera mucosa]MDG3005632.1 phosphoesterase [Paludisphaera mucosa]
MSVTDPESLHQGWLLTPEGAAVRPEAATAVIADVHLGYEWARGAAGDCVPAHSLAETRDRLERVFARCEVRCLIVAGDLVESHRPCARTAADVARLDVWLAGRGVELLLVPGNHDRSLAASPRPPAIAASAAVAGWTIQHGDRPVVGDRAVIGHHHPSLRVAGSAAPCFLVGPALLVLPAFSANAAGLDVATAAIPAAWRSAGLRCLAAAGEGLLDFGPLDSLAARLRSVAAQAH